MTPKELHRFWLEQTAAFIAYETGKYGCFIECGVKQGTSAIIIAKQMQRNGFLFDTWQGFPHFSDIDAPTDSRRKRLKKRLHGKNTEKDCKSALVQHGVDYLCTMIKGDICKTVPDFVKNKDLHIAYLHIDTDLYEPAHVSLRYFGTRMISCGGVFVHDYGEKKYPGIKIAVDDFIMCMNDLESSARLFIFPEKDFHAAFITFGGDNLDSEFREFHAKRK